MHVKEVTSHLETSQKIVDIRIIEFTNLNDNLLNVLNDNAEREKVGALFFEQLELFA